MPKVGMEIVRRRQLIDATISAIHEEGLANATISQISRRAGLSGGIVAHYFQDKAGLLEATMRSLAEDLRRGVVEHLSRAQGPEARVFAVIDANFAPEQFTPEVVTVWLSFWSQLATTPGLARIHRIYERRMNSNLQHAFKQLLPAAQARHLTSGLAALIDGLWLRCALTDGTIQADVARGIARDYVVTQLAALRRGGIPRQIIRKPDQPARDSIQGLGGHKT